MHGFSLQQLAKEAGVHWASIGKYEKGQQFIPLDYVYMVSRITGVPIGSLFGRLEAPTMTPAFRDGSVRVDSEADEVPRLVRAWSRIPGHKLRRAIVRLVRNIADAQSQKSV